MELELPIAIAEWIGGPVNGQRGIPCGEIVARPEAVRRRRRSMQGEFRYLDVRAGIIIRTQSPGQARTRAKGRRAVVQIGIEVTDPPLTRPRPKIGKTPIRTLPISATRTPIRRAGSRSGRRRAVIQIRIKVTDPPLTRPRPKIGKIPIRTLPIGATRTPIRSCRWCALVKIGVETAHPSTTGDWPVIGATLTPAFRECRTRSPIVIRGRDVRNPCHECDHCQQQRNRQPGHILCWLAGAARHPQGPAPPPPPSG